MYDNNNPHLDFSRNWEPLVHEVGTASVVTETDSSLSVVFIGMLSSFSIRTVITA